MRLLKRIVTGIAWTLLGTYTLLIVLLHIPAMQHYIGTEVSRALQEKLGTGVTVGRVDLGFLNRIIIDDFTIYDKDGKMMIRTGRMSAKIDYYPLAQGKISVSSAQLFGMRGVFYRRDASSQPNFSFVIDSLRSKDNKPRQPLDLRINSLVIRNGAISYDRYDAPRTPGRFNAAHIGVKDISAHIVIPKITPDDVSMTLKKLSFKETSGLDIRNISFDAHADKKHAFVRHFNILLPQSDINIDSIGATYRYAGDKMDMASLRYSGEISKTYITPCDIKCFMPSTEAFVQRFYIRSSIIGNSRRADITALNIGSSDNSMKLSAQGFVAYGDKGISAFRADIGDMGISSQMIKAITGGTNGTGGATDVAARLGDIGFRGFVRGKDDRYSMGGRVHTEAGDADIDADISKTDFGAKAAFTDINLQRILDDTRFGKASANIAVSGTMHRWKPGSVEAKGTVAALDFNKYKYTNITIDGAYNAKGAEGRIAMDDPNGAIDIRGRLGTGAKTFADITARMDGLALSALNLTDRLPGARIYGDLALQASGTGIDDIEGEMSLENFRIAGGKGNCSIGRMDITAGKEGMRLRSDFGTVDIIGTIKYTGLAQSLTNIIGDKLPALPNLPQRTSPRGNKFDIRADIHDTGWMEAIFGIPLETNAPLHIEGNMDDTRNIINIALRAGSFSYDGAAYKDMRVDMLTTGDAITTKMDITKVMENGKKMALDATATAADNKLATSVGINLRQARPIVGRINTETHFFKTDENRPAAHIHVRPSQIMINDTAWNVLPSDIVYSKKHIIFDNFAIEHNKQHIKVNGLATESHADSVTLDLKEVDVSYILDLVNFHSVEFSGLASGRAGIKGAFANPDARAILTVDNFKFQDGRMGTLAADVTWNKTDGQIDIDARATESADAFTVIKGYVSPARNYIDLGIDTHNTNIEFIESFCGSFMDNVRAHANGHARVYGDLSEVNLTGQLVADGTIGITPLNTTYRLDKVGIRMVPDDIIFDNDTVRDANGNIGIVDGALHHKNLTRLTYDIGIRAQNLLCYNFRQYGGNTFFGTVFATGRCNIKGRSGRIDMDVNLTPQKGSFIEYNAASPDAIVTRQFITWNDKGRGAPADTLATEDASNMNVAQQDVPDMASDMHINFLFNTTEDFTLRVLMDETSGDHIALNGTGSLHASYYNKGAFNMFGNYNISHGIYKLTIQNIIKKDFIFQPGSSIAFGGDPYHAALNLKAQHTINGVPLSDLQIGRSFSGNNVRVDCLMNIGGTPQSPTVDFDIDMPTVSTDAKQMVRSLINSEEEMNQQVIYLLGIGRFYTQSNNNAENTRPSQTSLAMQSLLSGTISQQINTLLSNFVNADNWNFGANVSTGNEGFNNAEYEALLTGRLLNNRLIINGQFGYRDNANATTSFIGDFDVRYLLYPNGNLAIKVYNQTNDRYFTKSSLNTQGIGIIMKRDFGSWKELFFRRKGKREF